MLISYSRSNSYQAKQFISTGIEMDLITWSSQLNLRRLTSDIIGNNAKNTEIVHVIVTAQKYINLNWFFFDPKHLSPQVNTISAPPSSILQHCQELFADEISKQYKCSVEIESIKFWNPKSDLSVDTVIDEEWIETLTEIKVLAKPMALMKSLSKVLGDNAKNTEIVHPKADLSIDTVIDEEWIETLTEIKVLAKPMALMKSLSKVLGDNAKNTEIVHVIVTAQKYLNLNWFFFDPKHLSPQVNTISAPPSSILQDCQGHFADEILKRYKCSVEIESIEFWTPKADLSVDTVIDEEWMKTSTEIKVLAKPIALVKSPSVALAEKLNDTSIVHIIVTATVIVTAEDEESRKEDDVVHDLPESERYRQAVEAKGKSPSAAAKSANYARNQKIKEQIIYDGRYTHDEINTLAPPIEIYHPIFNTFFHLIENPPKPTDDDLNNTREFMHFLSKLSQGDETSRNKQILNRLYDILNVDILSEQNLDRTTPDGIIRVRVGKERVPILIVELKKELGSGTCDPSIQAGLSMKRTWTLDDVMNVREKCCCPTFLLSGGGPWLGILGAVFADKVIVQRLTDIHWFGISSTEEDKRLWANTQTLLVLRESLKQLASFYQNSLADIRPWVPGPHPRLYPYPTSYPHPSTRREVKFEYQKALEPDAECVTFLARTFEEEPKNIIVKYVGRYGEEAHKFLANLNYAPRLYYHGPLPNSARLVGSISAEDQETSKLCLRPETMHMVVMEFIKSDDKAKPLREKLEEILLELHGEGYAFGDLRSQNVLVDTDGNVKLIDFDWCDEYDPSLLSDYVRDKLSKAGKMKRRATNTGGRYAYYPSSVSKLPEWPSGVGPLEPILPDHDWELLYKLF
ncbi:hypothetical protein Clacol_002361 [Clathrus columnatus]|uniref:Protein kinase domain-containing protein n=1 Tax=Clathrus columnatus TaxID=1419009 RepID=A0AAV5A4M9_9AGAM|nr:hypothetical protein Clacol_002361 [Clathrus columnatus]